MSAHCEIGWACISCGACVEECPKDAIFEGKDKYVIDSTRCDVCGGLHILCMDVCPVNAIHYAI